SGDIKNKPASDIGAADERVTVSPAVPTLATTASPALTLPTGPPGTVTLSDSAVITGGYFPPCSFGFTLTSPGGVPFTHTDPVRDNATYTASTALPTTGTVAGTYTWSITYGGDPNNNAANDQGGADEQTVVSPASPTLTTTPRPNTLRQGVTLKDTAFL